VEAHDASVLLVFNAWHEAVPFTMPAAPAGAWRLRLDTADPALGTDEDEAGSDYLVTGRSVLVFESRPAG
jgi:isoamylase